MTVSPNEGGEAGGIEDTDGPSDDGMAIQEFMHQMEEGVTTPTDDEEDSWVRHHVFTIYGSYYCCLCVRILVSVCVCVCV